MTYIVMSRYPSGRVFTAVYRTANVLEFVVNSLLHFNEWVYVKTIKVN